MRGFFIDLTEFLLSLRRTGIERISGEICKAIEPGLATPIRFHAGHYVALPPVLIEEIGRYFQDAGESGVAEIRRLSAVNGPAMKFSSNDRVLVPEIFGEPRAAFFHQMPEEELRRYRFIIYDLLPVTHPEFFPPEMPIVMSGYFHTMRRASECGFISDHTRDTFYGRLRRSDIRGGVVLPLGCDALGSRAECVSFNRPLTFSVLGTIEPRKNHQLILDAFEPLLGRIEGLKLSFIGKMGWVDGEFAQRVRTLADDKGSGFEFYSAPDDGSIRRYIEQSRATIYVSTAEGYGLPPVESLWAGTPVIASSTIPSLKNLGSAGIHYVEPLTIANLRRAVIDFVDDTYANQKIGETKGLKLPTWQSFTQEVIRWCAESPERD